MVKPLVTQVLYASGARVVIRDCEWVVRRADACDDGGYLLTVDGLSELVSGKSARFLTRLEQDAGVIRLLNPVETRLEQDRSPGLEVKDGIALGWEDIQHFTEGTVYKAFMDNTLPRRPGGVPDTVFQTGSRTGLQNRVGNFKQCVKR